MKLNLEQLKQITTGTVDIKEETGVFSFNRFAKIESQIMNIPISESTSSGR